MLRYLWKKNHSKAKYSSHSTTKIIKKNTKIILIQLTSFLFLAGHLTLYAYLTPFLQSIGIDGNWISMMYLLFGIAAIIGGGIGGLLSDRFGPQKKPLLVSSLFLR